MLLKIYTYWITDARACRLSTWLMSGATLKLTKWLKRQHGGKTSEGSL